MFARHNECESKGCQLTVATELVDYWTEQVLARRFKPCPRHQQNMKPENMVGDSELQDQAVRFLNQHPELFPNCERCGGPMKKSGHTCSTDVPKWDRKEARKNAKH